MASHLPRARTESACSGKCLVETPRSGVSTHCLASGTALHAWDAAGRMGNLICARGRVWACQARVGAQLSTRSEAPCWSAAINAHVQKELLARRRGCSHGARRSKASEHRVGVHHGHQQRLREDDRHTRCQRMQLWAVQRGGLCCLPGRAFDAGVRRDSHHGHVGLPCAPSQPLSQADMVESEPSPAYAAEPFLQCRIPYHPRMQHLPCAGRSELGLLAHRAFIAAAFFLPANAKAGVRGGPRRAWAWSGITWADLTSTASSASPAPWLRK